MLNISRGALNLRKPILLIMAALTTSTMVACNSAEKIEEQPKDTTEVVEDKKKEESQKEDSNNAGSDQGEVKDSDKNSKEDSQKLDKEGVKVEEPKPIDYNVVKPNEVGSILTVMYHGIKNLPPYHRTAENFYKDLTYMYENNYRPISMEDYLSNNIKVPAGMTPIVLTFDDGLSTSFSLVKDADGKLVPKEGTAVYIMEQFAKDHPGFGKAATFMINGDDAFYDGEGTYSEKLNWLVDNGYSLGNHTATHPKLSKLNGDQIRKEVGIVNQKIAEAVPGYDVASLAYPFGQRPMDHIDLIKEGAYNGIKYHNKVAYRVGYSAPYVAPNHVNYQPYNHPRVTGNEGQQWDLWYAFKYYEANNYLRYKSDGNPDTIVVPKSQEKNVNKESLQGKELITY